MTKEVAEKEVKVVHKNYCGGGGAGGAVYGLGMIGALFYYLQNVPDLNSALIGIFKAIFWPAYLVYEVLGLLGM